MQPLDGSGDLWQGGMFLPRRRAPIASPNQAPVAGADSATVLAVQTVTVPVLDNDADPEGGALTVTEASAGNGSVVVGADGTLAYTPNSGFSGTDTITYTVADPQGATSQGTVTVAVTEPEPVNQAPTAGADSATVLAGQTVTVPVLDNDADPEGGALTVTEASAGNGSVVVGADGTLAYTPNPGFSGTDTITYTVADPQGATSQGTVTVTVEAVSLSIETPNDGTLVINIETGEIAIRISEPAQYAGTYSVDSSALAAGPTNLMPPKVSGETAAGATLTALPGLWIYDDSFAPLQVARQWHRGTAPISGATGLTYVIQGADRPEGVKLVETASDQAGLRQVEVQALAPTATVPAPSPAGFVEKGAVFNGSSALVRNADLTADAPAVLWFASLTPAALARMGVLMLGGDTTGLSLRETGRIRVYHTNLSGSSDTDTVGNWTPGERLHLLAMKFPKGDGSRQMVQYIQSPGGPWTEIGNRSATPESLTDLTTGSFAVGAWNPPDRNFLKATVYRLSVWAGATVPDIRQDAVRGAFVSPDGAGLLDPAVSQALCGQALVDLYGPASTYQGGLNFGSAGNFSSVKGTFTDA